MAALISGSDQIALILYIVSTHYIFWFTLLIRMLSRQSTYTRTTSNHGRATQRARTTRTTTPLVLPEHPRCSTRLHGTYPRIPDVSRTSRPHLFRGSDRQLPSLLKTLGTPTATSRVHSAAPTNPTMRQVIPYPTTISIQSDPLHDHITTRVNAIIPTTTVCLLKSDSILPPTVESL